jgi:hypothetical protein
MKRPLPGGRQRGRRASATLVRWARSVAFTLGLSLLVAWAIAHDGRALPGAVLGAAALGLGLLYFLFPRGLHFAVGTATGLALYASLYTVLGHAQFPDAPAWARAPGFLLPVATFLGLVWLKRAELAEIAEGTPEPNLDGLPHALRWLFFAGLIGLVCFMLPVNRMAPEAQGAALLLAMAAISGIVALAVTEVVRLLVDVALIFDELGARLRHVAAPALAFLLMYVLIVIGFGAAFRIADGMSREPLFAGAEGPIRMTYSDALHFSVATISTVGYGDIRPADDGVRVLASAEVLAGQLLLLFGFAEIMRARRGRTEVAAPLDRGGPGGHSPRASDGRGGGHHNAP